MIRLRIKEIAEGKGINQTRLQIMAGVTVPSLRRYWHNKTTSVDLAILDKIAVTLGVEPGELLAHEEDAAASH